MEKFSGWFQVRTDSHSLGRGWWMENNSQMQQKGSNSLVCWQLETGKSALGGTLESHWE